MGKKSTMKVKTNGKKKFTGIGAVVAFFFILGAIASLGNKDTESVDRASVPLSTTVATTKATRVTTVTTVAETTAEKLTEAPETKATEPKTYWLNTESGKYHKAGCRTIKDGTTESYWESSTDIDYLKANYEACGVCKPY